MRTVLHVTDSASRLAGGMFESVRGLCKGEGTTKGWISSVVALEDAYSDVDRALWTEPLRLIPPSRFGAIGATRKIAEAIRAASPTIVHLHGIWGPACIAVRSILSRSPGPPVVVSPRGMLETWALQRSRIKKFIAWRAWAKAVLRRAAAIHALCDEEARSIRDLIEDVPIAVVPNGVNLPRSLVAFSGERQHDILFLGRIHPKKGIFSLLEAWPSVVREHRWRLIIAGWDDGGHLEALRSLAARLGLGESVIFNGPAFGEQKDILLRSVAAFILPSFSEGLPMAVLEAWSYGLPVIMTDACHLPEGFIANAAIRIHPVPESIAAGLLQLICEMTDAGREAMGARGRVLVETRFSWDSIGAAMCAVYDQATVGGDVSFLRHAAHQ
jgi:glycosyltransferase involved in cell wall biosynthesis